MPSKGDHIDNVYMDIPLFSSSRTIQRLKQKIQTFVEGEASADYVKIDVILNATNSHTKDGTSRACLQILFRVFHRNRWVDPEFAPRKMKSILFLRATLNELELEDLRDLIHVRRSLGYDIAPSPLNEAGLPAGFVGTSGRVHDSPSRDQAAVETHNSNTHDEMISGSVYLVHDPTVGPCPNSDAPYMSQTSETSRRPIDADETTSHGGVPITSLTTSTVRQRDYDHNLDARHVLVPETIQLSTNAANFQPYPNGFQFQR